MIRSSPCRKYLTFLLALGWSLEKIEDHCIELQLDYIDQAYLQKLLSDIARPKVFRPNDRRHAPSLLWLAEHGLSGLFPLPWVDAPREAFRHIQHRKAKEVIETLGLLRATPEKIVETLKLAKIQASVEGVSAALDLFWDLDILDQVELRALLELRLPSQAQLVDEDTAAKASAVKRASWSDPRRAVVGMPQNPGAILYAQSALGVPSRRLDIGKMCEIVTALLMQKVLEKLNSNRPEASMDVNSLLNGVRTTQEIAKGLSSPASASENLRAALIKHRRTGVLEHSALTTDQVDLSPYMNAGTDRNQRALPGAGAANPDPDPPTPEPEKVVPGEVGGEGE